MFTSEFGELRNSEEMSHGVLAVEDVLAVATSALSLLELRDETW